MRLACTCCLAFILCPHLPARDPAPLTLRDLLEQLAHDNKAVARLLDTLGDDPASGGFLPAEKRQQLLAALAKGKDALPERFPVFTIRELNVLMNEAGRLARKKSARASEKDEEKASREALGIPTGKPPRQPLPPPKELLPSLTQGHRADPDRAKTFADSERLAEILNTLALNDPEKPARASVDVGGKIVRSPVELIDTLAARGHTILVKDTRHVANFAALHYKDREVVTPLWLDTEIPIPGEKRTLQVPAIHSQHELLITGPLVKAEVAFYFGTDGKARFRAMPTKLQSWVGGRVVREYKAAQAREVVRLAGEMCRAFADIRQRYPDLPFNGYYTLGVCNDSSALIELALTRKTTHFPLVRDLRFFSGDGEIDRLARRLLVDGGREKPTLERVLATIPVEDWKKLAFPSLRADLEKVRGRKE